MTELPRKRPNGRCSESRAILMPSFTIMPKSLLVRTVADLVSRYMVERV